MYICNNSHCNQKFIHTAIMTKNQIPNGTIETKVCPYCNSLYYEEIETVKLTEPKIISVISVELKDIDANILNGYIVDKNLLYAKTATLIKYEKQKEETQIVNIDNTLNERQCAQDKEDMYEKYANYTDEELLQHKNVLSQKISEATNAKTIDELTDDFCVIMRELNKRGYNA